MQVSPPRLWKLQKFRLAKGVHFALTLELALEEVIVTHWQQVVWELVDRRHRCHCSRRPRWVHRAWGSHYARRVADMQRDCESCSPMAAGGS
jgi:hypothetical protein